MRTIDEHFAILRANADQFVTHWGEDDDPREKLRAAEAGDKVHFANEALRAHITAARAMLAALQDVELLARVNAPISDRSPMHRTIIDTIAQAKAAGITP